MPVAKNPIAGKNFSGPQFGGENQGFRKLGITNEPEFKGVYRSGPNPKLSTESGFTSKRDGVEDNAGSVNHAINTAGYAGPENWTPKSLGTRSPSDVTRSS